MSRVFAFILLIVLAPIFLVATVIIFFSDGMPLFFVQKRIGLNSKIFYLFKFRTMRRNTPDIATDLLLDPKSYYINFGQYLRKYSIDEIPQLINIIKGEMLFIGPRPALYNQKELILKRKSKSIDQIKPGITGWAQVNGRDNISIDKKVELDFFYLKNKSLLLQFKIIYLTILKVVKTENVNI